MTTQLPSDWWVIAPMDFILLALATWRLASLIVVEDGPWDLLAKMRSKLGVRLNEMGEPYGLNVVAEGITCVWCCSVWLGGLVAAAYWLAPTVTLIICSILSLSTAAILIERLVDDG